MSRRATRKVRTLREQDEALRALALAVKDVSDRVDALTTRLAHTGTLFGPVDPFPAYTLPPFPLGGHRQ